MKNALMIGTIFIILFNASVYQETNQIIDQKAVVKLLTSEPEVYVIVPDSIENQRYLPDSIPEQFKIDGCRIIFSGVVKEIPQNQKLVGTPIIISKINLEK